MRDSTLDRRMAEMAAHGDTDTVNPDWKWELAALFFALGVACGVLGALGFVR